MSSSTSPPSKPPSQRPSTQPRPPGRFFTLERPTGPPRRSEVPSAASLRRSVSATVALVVLSYAFRLPALLNARSTNSDAAVVGLQAMHILRGERSAFLWGSGYQTSADAFVAAGFFAVLGPSPLALMLSSLTLHVILTLLVFSTLRRHLMPWTSFAATLPLVLSPASVHTYALYPPRQAALTIAIAAFWAIDGAAASAHGSRSRLWLAAGGVFTTLAVAADPYPLLLVPLALLFAILVALVPAQRGVARLGFLPYAAGALVGAIPYLLLRRAAGAKSGPLGLTVSMVGHHFDLLVSECLPWALSYKVYFARDVMDYRVWEAPLAFRIVGMVGALVVFMLVLYGIAALVLRSVPWPLRRLGLVGGLTFFVAIGGFLVSVMVMDHFSMRYLVVLTLMLPFAAAPAAYVYKGKPFALILAPHLVASSICGWLGYSPFVRGIMPVRETPELADDYRLRDLMQSRAIAFAMADYWASYRLTLLHRETIVVVPRNPAEDRYAPYRRAFEAAPTFVYLWDPGRSRESLDDAERELRAANAVVERTNAGRLVVFVVKR